MPTLHSIATIPILEGALGASLPFLFLEDGELSILALAWVRQKMLNEAVSPSTVAKAVAAIGRFYDFYMLEKKGAVLASNELPLTLSQFYEARRFGLASTGWTPVKQATAVNDVRAVSEFTEWCTNNFGNAAVNPREKVLVSCLNLSEQRAFRVKLASSKRWNPLHHLAPSTKEGQGVVTRSAFNPSRGTRSKTSSGKKYFPPDKVWTFIGATSSIRDKLYFLLLFFGGLRISEPLHLFATDVSIRPDGTARVLLGHPQDGAYKWFGADKKQHSGNRATFLAERYGLGARNLLAENDPLHAGWKGMAFDDPNRSESEVHWIREDASQLFARLHSEYIRTVRSKLKDVHPYYFVNERDGPTYGLPLKASNISKAFIRAADRISVSTRLAGVNPHGGRHFYGYYCASILRLPIETTQKVMHHQSMLSTEVYYALSGEAVRSEMMMAQARLALDTPNFLTSPLLPTSHS